MAVDEQLWHKDSLIGNVLFSWSIHVIFELLKAKQISWYNNINYQYHLISLCYQRSYCHAPICIPTQELWSIGLISILGSIASLMKYISGLNNVSRRKKSLFRKDYCISIFSYFYTNTSRPQRPHISNIHLCRGQIIRMYLLAVR